MSDPKNLSTIPLIQESETVFHDSIIYLRRDRLQRDDHPPYPYYVLELRPFAVIILAFTKDNKILTIQEYRHPTGHFILSYPAGYVETDEDFLHAAKRELLEETGYQAELFEIIGKAYPYAGISNQQNIYVRALGASYLQPPELEKSEIIQTKLMTKTELLKHVQNHVEMDANILTALSFHDLAALPNGY